MVGAMTGAAGGGSSGGGGASDQGKEVEEGRESAEVSAG